MIFNNTKSNCSFFPSQQKMFKHRIFRSGFWRAEKNCRRCWRTVEFSWSQQHSIESKSSAPLSKLQWRIKSGRSAKSEEEIHQQQRLFKQWQATPTLERVGWGQPLPQTGQRVIYHVNSRQRQKLLPLFPPFTFSISSHERIFKNSP